MSSKASQAQITQSTPPNAEVSGRDILYFFRQSIIYLRPYWRQQIHLGLTVLALVVYDTALPLSTKYLIDSALIPQNGQMLWELIIVMGLLYVVSAVARVIQTYIRALFGRELFRDLFITFYGYLPDLPESYYQTEDPGEVTSYFSFDLIMVGIVLRDLVIKGVAALLQLIIIMGTLFFMSWQMALIVMIILPFTVIIPQRLIRLTTVADYNEKQWIANISAAVDDFIKSQAIIRAFDVGALLHERFTKEVVRRQGARITRNSLVDFRSVEKSNTFLARMTTISTEIQQNLINVLVISMGAWLAYTGMISLGTFSTYVLFIPKVSQAIVTLTSFFSSTVTATVGLKRAEKLRAWAEPEQAAVAPIMLPRPTQEIWFNQVSFGYMDQVHTLKKLNLVLPIGRSMAVVGRSGSGKSTLIKLLMRFYSPSEGRVLVDGLDLQLVNRHSLRSQMSAVLQQNVLLNGTIRENISIAKPDATDEEVIAAAKAAEIHETIANLPDGYNTQVGQGGNRFSEGQRQRIALARAIIRNPAILVLDEVTSALDPATEASINATIQRLAQDRTVVMVTHRLSAITFVDQIIVMDDGEICERGQHEELLQRQGVYQQFWQIQSGFEISQDGHHAKVKGERLRAIPLFQNLEEAALDHLAEQFTSESYAVGEHIYRQGDAGENFHIIVRGLVSVTAMSSKNQAVKLATLQDGEYFGEGEILNHGRRTTTVQAQAPTLVLTLHIDRFRAIMDEVLSLQKVMKEMALGRSLTTISSLGRRRRNHPIWDQLASQEWIVLQLPEK